MRAALAGLCLLLAAPAAAQESKLAAEFRRERERIAENCDGVAPKSLMSCAVTIATDHPIHLAMGNLAPGNGFALGVAFVTSHAPSETWRLSWNADAVASFGGSWRAGAYMKMIHTPVRGIKVVPGGTGTGTAEVAVQPHTVIDIYAEATSLETLLFYGLGPDTPRETRAAFGQRQTIVGTSAIVPITRTRVARALNLALLGEVNGRFVTIRPGAAADAPALADLYSEATAPGLEDQPGVVQFGEGVRLKPALAGNRLKLDYLAALRQFVGGSDSTFRQWTLDLDHQVPIYRTSAAVATRDTNGPDECAASAGAETCPPISRDRYGAFGFRALVTRSTAGGSDRVPFYFQPTLGGSDINGRASLASYDDYRFRGASLVLFQETFEHSLYGPVGIWLQADQGTVAREDDALADSAFKHSYSAGLSLRAGGFPQVMFFYAWGGSEGRHVTLTMNVSLLGGSRRPSQH